MAWTQQQKDDLLPLVKMGWRRFCESAPAADPGDQAAMVSWYKSHMLICCGHPSVDTLGSGLAIDIVMDYFKSLAVNNDSESPMHPHCKAVSKARQTAPNRLSDYCHTAGLGPKSYQLGGSRGKRPSTDVSPASSGSFGVLH